MKKLSALILALILIFSLVSCGRVKKNSKDETKEIETEIETGETKKAEETGFAEETEFVGLGDFIYKDMYEVVEENQESFEEASKTFEDYGIKMTILAEDESTLVYAYQYENHMPEEGYEAMINSFESMDNSSFISLASQLEDQVAAGNVKIILRYVNDNDDVIWEGVIDKDSEYTGSGTPTTFDSLEEYIDSDAAKHALDSLSKQIKGVAECEVKAEGDNLVYEITLITQYSEEEAEQIAEGFGESLESSRETLEAASKMLSAVVEGVEDPHMVYRVLNHDGSLICEYTY